jgi:hypothetical protein
VLVPTVLFAVPALFGHPAIAQDNFIQNYPLRVLSARQLLSGHLPLFNPLANSGTPLLGGMNAGSFYPLSLLFVVLPSLAAWVINLIAVYAVAGVGLYALGRWLGLRSSAALVASATYAYAGAMMGQMVHLQVVQGYSLLPWLVLSELALARSLLAVGESAPWRRQLVEAAPAVVGVALIWGLVFLSGEPRAIAEAELVSLVVLVVELVVHAGVRRATGRGRALLVVANALGAAWGAAIGLVQLLPGWAFITQSERSSEGYFFFGSGSLSVKWTTLLVDQDLLGSNGSLGAPHYFAGYNLAEVTGYVGILALCAVVAFFAQLTWRGWRGEQRGLIVFAALFVVGLWASWGNFTPVGHLFHALPLFGKTRLQSRNLILVDLGAAVLLGWWLEAVFAHRRSEASLVGWRRALTALPALGALGVAGWMSVAPTSLLRAMGVARNLPDGALEKVPLGLHLALAAGVLVVVARGCSRRRSGRWVVALVVADLLLFNVFCDVGFALGSTSTPITRAGAVAVLGDRGRYAIVDPGQANLGVLEPLGVPNLNVFTGLPTIQGYGSLVGLRYGAVTGSHPMVALDGCNLERGEFAQLRLDTLVLTPSALAYPYGERDPDGACLAPTATTSTARYFGTMLTPRSITLDLAHGGAGTGSLAPAPPISIQLLGARGQPVGAPQSAPAGSVRHVVLSHPAPAAGFRVSSAAGAFVLSGAQVRVGPTAYRLDNAFQAAMGAATWRLASTTADYSVFHATSLRRPQWLVGAREGDRITRARSASWGDEWITVHTRDSLSLVRSVAWLAGWRAELVDESSGTTRSVPVRRDGLVQAITVPPGRWVVHFHYHAPYVELALGVSCAAVLGFAVVLAMLAGPRVRSRRRGRVSA